MTEFRSPTGQTGTDAYIYEAAQIANAQRELDERLKRLLEVVHDEAPELFDHKSDWDPRLGVRDYAKAFLDYLLTRSGRVKS